MWQEENSRVTAELRELIDAGVNIWDFDYPSYYKGEEKAAFEKKVIDHFYMRQIGAETVGRFLHYFRRTVREIMPYYIQRYKSVELMEDPDIRPLDNYNMIEEYTAEGSEDETRSGTTGGTTSGTETRSGTTGATTTSEGTSSGTGSKTTSESSKDTSVHSDTPQGQLSMSIAADGSATLAYASDLTQQVTNGSSSETSTASEKTSQSSETSGTSSESVETSGTTSGTSSETGAKSSTDKHKLTRRGNIGVTTYAQLLQGYRETFLNIDMEVINELEICFLGVF